MTPYNIPFSACHELAHLRGFMQEEEANFIAFLAGTGADSPELSYSSYLLGWINCTNALFQVDEEAYRELYGELSEGVKADLAANSAFWERYDGAGGGSVRPDQRHLPEGERPGGRRGQL